MRYIAVIRDSVVASVVVVNDDESLTVVAEVNSADDALDVSDMTPRPGPGWTWTDNIFRSPSPYPSWEWDGTEWVAPVPRPTDPGPWVWNEDTGSWDSVTPDTE
jgi:hypothetical protein